MLSDLELNILAGFYPRPHQRLLPVIQRSITYPPEEVYASLKSLEARGIVDIIWLGGATVFTLNVATDEAFDGYLFYVRRKEDMFAALEPGPYGSISRFISVTGPEIALVLGERTPGDDATGQAESPQPESPQPALVITITREEGRAPDGGGDTCGNGYPDDGTFVTATYSQSEFRGMKRTDSDTLREIVNFAFPIQGAVPYFEFLYRDLGV